MAEVAVSCLRRIHGAWAAAVAGAFAATLAASSARAAPSEPLDRARGLFVQAEGDEDEQRWSDALDKFRVVGQVKMTAGVRYHIALCEEHLGRLTQALGEYKLAQDQAFIDDAKDVLQAVSKQLAALEPRVPRLSIHLIGEQDASVTVDGQAIPHAVLSDPVRVDPGPHRIEAMTSSGRISAATVSVRESETKEVDVDLEPPVVALPAPPPPPPASVPAPAPAPLPPPPRPPAAPPPHVSSHRGGAVVATAVAVTLAAGGTAAYVLAGITHDNNKTSCAANDNPASDACEGLKEEVRGWDLAAAGGWTAALLAASVAVVLWTRPGDATSGGGAHVLVGPSGVSVRGSF